MASHPTEKSLRVFARENECHLAIGAVLVAQRGVGQSIAFIGPRGIGKSALLQEIGDRVEDLLSDPVICEARFISPTGLAPIAEAWATRLAATCLGERLTRAMRPAALATVATQASRRNETHVRRLLDEVASALQANQLSIVLDAVVDLARLTAARTRLPVLFLLDDLHLLIQNDPASAELLEQVISHTQFTWIATAAPGGEGRQPLLSAFRRALLAPLDVAGSSQALQGLCAKRGRALPGEIAKAIGACLQGHGSLSDAYARELALSSDPEPGLETHVRLLIDSLEQGAFAAALASEFRALFPQQDERTQVLEALCRLAEEDSTSFAGGSFSSEPAVLARHAAQLRALGLLDWQTEGVAPTPLWAVRQLCSMWRDQALGRNDIAGGRLWRCSQALRRMHSVAPAGQIELDNGALAACLAALSGAELDAGHFVMLPESIAPSGRIRLPLSIATEPLNVAATISRFSASNPTWIAMAGMLGLTALDDTATGQGEMSLWVLAAFSPPISVNEEDVRHVRQLAELIALDASGVRPSGIWIIGGEFRPTAERVAEMEGVILMTWSAWRELNALPLPDPEQMDAESPPLFDPSGLAFALDLPSGTSNDPEAAIEAAQALAQRSGFAPDQCREIIEAVRRGCQSAMTRTSQLGARARIRARLEDQALVVAIEHEMPRWKHAGLPGGYSPEASAAWDVAPLKSRMDEVMTEHLPWGYRLTLRKRLDPFAQLT